MLKKAIAAFVAAAVVIGCCFLVLHKGRDEVTFMQRQYINQYLSSYPFEKGKDGADILPYIAAASQIDGFAAEEFLGARNQIDYRTGSIEVRVAVADSGDVVLAGSYASIGEEPVKLSRVIKQMSEDSVEMLVVNLSEYSRLSAINYVLSNSYVQTSCVITGVNENAFEYVKNAFPKLQVLCDYGEDSRMSFEQLCQVGASGILVSPDSIDKDLFDSARKAGLSVWVNCEDDLLATVKAISFSPDGIITSRPDFARTIVMDWSENGFDMYFKNK